MITQGFRETIINDDTTVTGSAFITAGTDAEEITIDGIGTFKKSDLSAVGNITVAAEAATLGAYTVTASPTVPAAGEDVTVEFFLTIPGRTLGELFPEPVSSVDFTVRGDGTKTLEALLAAQVIAGFNDKIFSIVAGAATEIKVTFKAGYEGVGITHVHSSLSLDDATAPTVELTVVEDTAPNAGLNTGKDLEANVRLATPENTLYGYNPHGQGMIVDPRATYTSYTLNVLTSQDGWEPHEAMGHQDVNQQLGYKTTKYIFYANDASSTATKVLLKSMVDFGGTPVA